MNIKIITAMHGRVGMTKAFLMAMRRIEKKFGITTHAVVTTNDPCVGLCEEYGIDYFEHDNDPRGVKWNAVCEHMRDKDFSHLMVLGSDDIPSDSFIEGHIKKDGYDIVGIWDLWFWGLNPRRAGFNTFGYWSGTPGRVGGVCRTFSKRVCECVDWRPWADERRGGMDGAMMSIIKRSTPKLTMYAYSLKDTGGFVMDVKYEKHISSLSPTLRNTTFQEPMKILNRYLPPDEVEYLMELRRQVNQ